VIVTYTGNVQPGGPADVRELSRLRITKLAVDEQMSNNCYLLTCTETGEQLLIDAAADAGTLLGLVGEAGLATVVTTHQHWDHHRALAEVVAATGARVVAGLPDADAITVQTGVPVTEEVQQGGTVSVGSCRLEVIALAGHTPGSIALLYDDSASAGGHAHLFTGDSLFPGGIGNTTNEGQSFESLVADVSDRVFDVYDDATWVYPGHGGDTSLGVERPHLTEWRERGW